MLDGFRWQGSRVIGDRAQTLPAVLALHGRAGAGNQRLVEELWCDEPLANPTKALQVVASTPCPASNSTASSPWRRLRRSRPSACPVDARVPVEGYYG
ncbi:hypothetical protein OHA25_21690 [Nonomuraea sp. NBC_00507]|uniref:hypothetical protein n=1 Tax=Nonomuraea sp. NBC_00507 TaxID=2976002 RepID=UPI002E194771